MAVSFLNYLLQSVMLSGVEASLPLSWSPFASIVLKPPFMRELTEEEAYRVTAFMEKLVVGLASLGSHYNDNNEDLAWAHLYMITPKLWKEASHVRSLLFSKYNRVLTEGEDLDELEKMFVGLNYLKTPTPKQLARFRKHRLNKQK